MDKIYTSDKILCVMLISYSLAISVEDALMGFQTSMGVKKALGSTNMLVVGVVYCISSISLYAVFAKTIGRKWTLIIGQILGIPYTLANFWPRWWTLIPSAVCLGVNSAFIRIASSSIVSSVVTNIHEDEEKHKRRNLAMLNAVIMLGQGCSFLIAEVVMDTLNGMGDSGNFTYDVSKCASNDCPMEYAFDENNIIFKSLIPNRVSVIVLLCIFLMIHIVGVVLSYIFTPDNGSDLSRRGRDENAPLLHRVSKRTLLLRDVASTLCEVFREWCSLKGIFVTPAFLFYGILDGFIWSDFTRAFVSCVIGVNHIGSCIFVVGVASFITSMLLSVLARNISFPTVFITALVLQLIYFPVALMWIPNSQTLYIFPYVNSLCFGIMTGMSSTIALSSSGLYFKDADVGYTILYTSRAFGLSISSFWVNFLCIYIKIYVLIGMSILSTASLSVVHFRLK